MTKAEKAKYMRDWHAKHPGYRKQKSQEWYAAHPGYNYAASKRCRDAKPEKYKAMDRERQLRTDYEVGTEWYENEFAKQGGVCAICGDPPGVNRTKRLSIDHNHTTQQNRGLLCVLCNTALNRIEKVASWGAKAEAYLAKYEGGDDN